MRFRGLDLNLLAAFVALVETSSVTQAASRLNLSQPGMSSALKRLREYFDDEILVAHGKRMHPTAYADALLPQIKSCLDGIGLVIQAASKFDPATSVRTFSLAASDYITATVLAPLIQTLATTAPGVKISITLPNDHMPRLFEDGRIDMILCPDAFLAERHPSELLFEEREVVVGWAGNPALDEGLTESVFLALGHIAIAVGDKQLPAFADRQLDSLGKARRVEIWAASFTVVPWLLQGTHRITVMHERLALSMAKMFPLSIAPMPFDFPTMREMVQYHSTRQSDEGLTWLRRQLSAAAAAQPLSA